MSKRSLNALKAIIDYVRPQNWPERGIKEEGLLAVPLLGSLAMLIKLAVVCFAL